MTVEEKQALSQAAQEHAKQFDKKKVRFVRSCGTNISV